MNKGIAHQIRLLYPEVLLTDRQTKYGDKNKLGTYSACKLTNLTILNCYTQYRYGFGLQLDYPALQKVLMQVKYDFPNKKIGMPKIGCNNAGGDWRLVEKIVNDIFVDQTVYVYYLDEN
jgi:hypothetical protein